MLRIIPCSLNVFILSCANLNAQMPGRLVSVILCMCSRWQSAEFCRLVCNCVLSWPSNMVFRRIKWNSRCILNIGAVCLPFVYGLYAVTLLALIWWLVYSWGQKRSNCELTTWHFLIVLLLPCWFSYRRWFKHVNFLHILTRLLFTPCRCTYVWEKACRSSGKMPSLLLE
jgi:hypothetical protein